MVSGSRIFAALRCCLASRSDRSTWTRGVDAGCSRLEFVLFHEMYTGVSKLIYIYYSTPLGTVSYFSCCKIIGFCYLHL